MEINALTYRLLESTIKEVFLRHSLHWISFLVGMIFSLHSPWYASFVSFFFHDFVENGPRLFSNPLPSRFP